MSFKVCAVQGCSSNSENQPNMQFIAIPTTSDVRKIWLKLIRASIIKFHMYCCELHFDLQNDCVDYDDYVQPHEGFRRYFKVKRNVVPHKNLPPSSLSSSSSSESSYAVEPRPTEEQILSSGSQSTAAALETLPEVVLCEAAVEFESTSSGTSLAHDPLGSDRQHSAASSSSDIGNGKERPPVGIHATSSSQSEELIGVQSLTAKATAEDELNLANPCTTLQPSRESLYVPPSSSSGTISRSTNSASSVPRHLVVTTQLEFTMRTMKENPKKYMGIYPESAHILQILQDATGIAERDLFIVLRKLRRDEPYWLLADCFSLSVGRVGKIVQNEIKTISEAIEEFVIWPDANEVQYHLPNGFKHRYAAVNTIIDCFEIQIQKPSNAIHQSLTYSSYKKCNTIKYLIGCLPDGVINYISKGAGGRTSDQQLVQQSGFLEKLSANTMVMADRGFKAIETDLRSKRCKLIRPPSTTANHTMSKNDVMENKRIASLRIHIERAIGRLREFAILEPHATVDSKLVPKLDYFVTIACGLCNIQSDLIK